MTTSLYAIRKSCDLAKATKLTLVVLISVIAVARPTPWFVNAQTFPLDVQTTCAVKSAVFVGWFQTGPVKRDGVVNPADSVTFFNNDNCSFYQWSEQMFLWLTSPTPVSYGGGGGRIFDSPVFYDVSPLDANGNRTFIPHTPGLMRNLNVRNAQVGAHALPVIMDRSGRMFEVVPPSIAPSGRQLILNRKGHSIEVASVTIKNEKPIFMNEAGQRIRGARPIIGRKLSKTPTVQKFVIAGIPIFLDPSGNVIDTEQGQAEDGGVLEAQNGSLVYYAITVNDVYAYFLTGAKTLPANGGISPTPTQFPTTPAELNQVVAFALSNDTIFPDPNALAIQVKTAWVEATGLQNLSTYITMQATIPTYTQTPNLWTPKSNEQKTVLLALVGMHVVGFPAGNPAGIWATFEHFGNTPNAAYTYNSQSGIPQTVNQDTSLGPWLFCANGSLGPFNKMHMQNPSGTANILSVSPFTISASDTLRFKPWGAASNAAPNPACSTPVCTIAASNTEIISINNSVLSQLVNGDIRRNYFMTGATWTIGGIAPTTSFGNPGNTGANPGKAVGTSQSANTTMETYPQVNTFFDKNSNNCFSCHNGNMLGDPNGGGLSHIYGPLKPLFP